MTVSHREPEPTATPVAAPLCWRELMQIALDGLPSAEFRLEEMMDRIERPS